MKKQFNYFYKITNNINNHFYYGVHCTDNLDDGYMGSGKRLHFAYKKYGIENFSKEILKFFETSKEAFEYEAEIVTESLCQDPNCYNIQQGGRTFHTKGLMVAKDQITGKCFMISNEDPRYLTGELHGVTYGKSQTSISVLDKTLNKRITISKEDPRYLSGEFHGLTYGYVPVKDKNGNFYLVDKNDYRYISGELVHNWIGKKHTEETKEKMRKYRQEHHPGLGEKNSQFGTCWITKEKTSKKIKKTELETYINNGWVKGRKIKDKKLDNLEKIKDKKLDNLEQ